MNNSIFTKNKMGSKNNAYFSGINFNDLSATSSVFMSNIRPNMKGGFRKMFGGVENCPCMDALKAFNDKNLDLALYILINKQCCLECKDSNGNTILHHLVLCSKDNSKCADAIDNLIKSGENTSCINQQNNKGQTPILLAVKIENSDVANKLDLAGADKSIKDNDGNFVAVEDEDGDELTDRTDRTIKTPEAVDNLFALIAAPSRDDESDDVFGTSLDLGTDIKLKSTELSRSNIKTPLSSNVAVRQDLERFINTIGNLFINKKFGNDDILYGELRDTMPGPESEIKFVNIFETDRETDKTIDDLIEKLEKDSKDQDPKYPKDLKVPENKELQPEMNSDTDEFIKVLAKKYSEGEKKPNQEVKVVEVSKDSKDNVANTGSDIESSVNTEALMDAISKLNEPGEKEVEVKVKQDGGSKIMGYRNVNLSDSSFVSDSFNYNSNSNSNSDYELGISDAGYNTFYNDSEYGAVTNELSRMMQRQRDNLHEQVLDMIMSMLNKGEIVKDSVVIKSDEKNAKLIKAYVYRKVSEKNPQMGGLDKILAISKMSEQQISDLIEDMPNLDQLEKNIQKHIEHKQTERKTKSDKKSKKTDNSIDDTETIDFSLSESNESETPKKKDSKSKSKTKAKAKDTKSKSKAKKSSKK